MQAVANLLRADVAAVAEAPCDFLQHDGADDAKHKCTYVQAHTHVRKYVSSAVIIHRRYSSAVVNHLQILDVTQSLLNSIQTAQFYAAIAIYDLTEILFFIKVVILITIF